LLTVFRSSMNVANSVLWRMAIILKANKVHLFVSSVLFVFWYQWPNFLDTPRMSCEQHLSMHLDVIELKNSTSRSLQNVFANKCKFYQCTRLLLTQTSPT
jgi:hypothetical protein